jgi:hypothetical protein
MSYSPGCSSSRLTISWSMEAFPARSPTPSTVPCTRAQPAASAVSEFAERQAPVVVTVPLQGTGCSRASKCRIDHSISLFVPVGDAAPTVSHNVTRVMPCSSATS